MGIQNQSSLRPPSTPTLGQLAAALGVHPSEADLESVRGFLDAIVPALEELERALPPETVPAGIFAPIEGP